MDPMSPTSSNTVTLRPMPQLEHLWTPEDDWTGVIDRTHRRRLQNRLNQRAYRQKHKVATGHSSSSNTQTLIPHSSPIHHPSISSTSTSTSTSTSSAEEEDLQCTLAPHNVHQLRHAFSILATQSYLTNCPRLEHLLSLSRLNVHRAINDNIRILGMTPAWLQPDDALSIFNTTITNSPSPLPNTNISTSISISKDIDISSLPESLRPTPLQHLIPHHPWLDFFPFPEIRDRLILAAAAGHLDEDELCRDLMAFWDTRNSGATLVVWGGGMPWDPWNWEVTEAFLGKWRWVVSGIRGLVRSTNYWRGRRGEKVLRF
ncbi:hypothetical protein AbraCBS73388_006976 [Aspergillus brasiliensis]|uniref:BZIP domain-containing protein n=1 Tax=Aspergillus brasiliensis TaxID=319629 RepID=A0A9W5YSF9_9EURO|nr:hypothetical protein AbraCBS73388_006976 [Aspergillus brasiliensis]